MGLKEDRKTSNLITRIMATSDKTESLTFDSAAQRYRFFVALVTKGSGCEKLFRDIVVPVYLDNTGFVGERTWLADISERTQSEYRGQVHIYEAKLFKRVKIVEEAARPQGAVQKGCLTVTAALTHTVWPEVRADRAFTRLEKIGILALACCLYKIICKGLLGACRYIINIDIGSRKNIS